MSIRCDESEKAGLRRTSSKRGRSPVGKPGKRVGDTKGLEEIMNRKKEVRAKEDKKKKSKKVL